MPTLNSFIFRMKLIFGPYWAQMQEWNFSLFNPLFWIMVLIIFLFLLRSWKLKKAFSFCVVTAIILLSESQFESYILSISSGDYAKGLLSAFVRRAFIGIIAFVVLYYFFIKGDE